MRATTESMLTPGVVVKRRRTLNAAQDERATPAGRTLSHPLAQEAEHTL